MKISQDKSFEQIKSALKQRERMAMSPLATRSKDGLRRLHEEKLEMDYRQAFSLDVDRILHSLAYTRYIDKTQVFYLTQNDHITHRVLHVQLVSKIARTIGRFLGLNEDLIEAISLGHDIGHAPFGHDGESFLSKLCRDCGIGYFYHNVQSVQFLDKVERKGTGRNLCLQTLDGILCHDGEIHNRALEPERGKTFQDLEKEISKKKTDPETKLIPMTLEGCVVRMADTVSYIGRDIEDAIRLQMIRRSDLPVEAVKLLGNTNGTIIYNLVTDIIKNSFQNLHISFSLDVSDALKRLKDFNIENIYLNPKIKNFTDQIRRLFEMLFVTYLSDIEKENRSSVIFTNFLENMSEDYIENHCGAEIVRDFIAGMTDQYFLRQCPEKMRPEFQVCS
ncbi:MAG: HD domain-containing protein [Desulfobacterales bacterium]|nr:HD domain-containing protein [Desulfobacterales bacterium]